MKKIKFSKMVASGNDFVAVDSLTGVSNIGRFAKTVCDRKYGIGADGLLIVSPLSAGLVRMRIFNADGSEAEMCGNGARCAALFSGKKKVIIKTIAGLVDAQVSGGNVKIKLTQPKFLKLDIPIKINGRPLKVNFVNTGVPHTVVPVEGIGDVDVFGVGRSIRYHKYFAPAGTNVNFIEVLNSNSIQVRTYERGVEDETLACGTGSVASSLVFASKVKEVKDKVNVHTQGGEVLRVYFKREGAGFSDVWLEGKAKLVYKGEY
jgi:diaminopimelate epimerase